VKPLGGKDVSYCRWLEGDVYAYRNMDGDGWTIHVHARWDGVRREADGKTFHEATLESFKARLLGLRKAGYQFPDDALERVEEELAHGLPDI
jgi:hypothetical protein